VRNSRNSLSGEENYDGIGLAREVAYKRVGIFGDKRVLT